MNTHPLAVAAFVLAAAPLSPASAESLIDASSAAAFNVGINQGADATQSTVSIEGESFDVAIRVEVASPTNPAYAAQVLTPRNRVAVEAGDRLVGSYWIRAEPVGGSSPNVPAFLFTDTAEWTQLVWLGTNPGPEWEEQTFAYTADRDHAAGSIAGNFHLGAAAQNVEIAAFTLEVEKAEADPDAAPTPDAASNPIDPELADRLGPSARLIISGNTPVEFSGPGPAAKTSRSLVSVEGQPFEQATRVTVGASTAQIWDSQLTSPASTGPVKEGDVLFGMIDVRASSVMESGGGQFVGWLQTDTEGWHGFRKLEGAPGRTWSRRFFTAVADRNAPAGDLTFVFQLGVMVQEFEVANMLVWNLGPDADLDALPKTRLTYPGQEPDAPWRAEAEELIQQNRMGDLAVSVIGADGEPVEDAEVRVMLKDRAFQLGTFLDNNFAGIEDSADGRTFTRTVKDLFNRVTVPSYGGQTWGWPDPASRASYLKTIEWAMSQEDMVVKAHPIVWSRFDYMPASFAEVKDDPAALRAEIRRYVTEVATILGEHGVQEVDALNEPIGFTAFDEIIDDPGLRAEWFMTAHEAAPSLELILNEHSILSAGGLDEIKQERLEGIIQDLLDRGVPLAGLGFQGHIGEDFTPPEQLWEVLDRFAAFGLPLHITEFDINTEDDQTQADYLRDFITAMYAHPAVGSVTLWGFWGGAMWIPQAELWREDWTMKPGAEALVELSTRTLHTDEMVTTGTDGTANVRGHTGTYLVSVNGVEQEAELTPEGATVVLQLP